VSPQWPPTFSNCPILPTAKRTHRALLTVVGSLALGGCPLRPPHNPYPTLTEVPLVQSAGDPFMGGRVVAVTLDPRNDNVAIAATQSGGLFRTTNGAASWHHIDNLAPNRFWDVQVHPNSPDIVIATVVVDTHNPPLSGVWRSTDGGLTWSRPSAANFPDCNSGGTVLPAYGRWISTGPGNHVFVATDCGLAVSHDLGASWYRVVPNPATPAVSGVFSHPGPLFSTNPNDVIVDVCGPNGPQRSTDAGASFAPRTATNSFPLSRCFMSGSPDDPNVLFSAQNVPGGIGILWESDDGGTHWTMLTQDSNVNRYAWVRTTRTTFSPQPKFDLFYHDGADVFHLVCDSSRTGTRCDPTTKNFFSSPPHDYGGMALGANGCPRYMGNDHGIVVSTDCGNSWVWRHNGLHALQVYDMAGTLLPDHLDLYLATQDNSIWGSADGGITWPNRHDSEGFHLQAPHAAAQNGFLVTSTIGGPPAVPHAWWQNLQFDLGTWPLSTDQNPPPFPSGVTPNSPFIIPGTPGPSRFLEVKDSDLWVRSVSGLWTQKNPSLPPFVDGSAQRLFVGGPPDDAIVYFVSPRGDANNTHTLIRVTGIDEPQLTITDVGTTLGDVYIWAPDDGPYIFPFVVGVAPQDGRWVAVGDNVPGVIRFSTDAGTTWRVDNALLDLVTDQGRLLFSSPFHGLQVHVIKYNPSNVNHILVGTEASGVIESCDGGTSWRRMPGSRAANAVSDFFFDEARRTVYVSTYGRGLWRFVYPVARVDSDRCWEPPPIVITVPPRATLAIFVTATPPDPVHLDVSVDGVVWLAGVAPPFSSARMVLAPGPHQLQARVTPGSGDPAQYLIRFGGSCQVNGTLTVTQGQAATCDLSVIHQ
jgi:photosystem II stability/assembly factor-like uncharacterized protein